MALKIEWTNTAVAQLDNIIQYLEENWSAKEVKAFFTMLEKGIESIQKAPQQHKKSSRKSGTSEYQLSPQTTIFYTFDKQRVTILLFWSNRMNPRKL